MSLNPVSNMDRVRAAWGADMPEWVRLLAAACDQTSQGAVAKRLGKSGGYISRLINHNYAGSYDEAETIVRAQYAGDRVECPVWDHAIPLSSCLRNRRHRGPERNGGQRAYARFCPTCAHNTDIQED